MDERFRFAPGTLKDDVIAISAYDGAGACIARELRPALEAYANEIDLIDEPGCRRDLNVRRIVAEQSAREAGSAATRWAMSYDENGTLTDALEHDLSNRRTDAVPGLANTGLRLAQRLRWIGVPGTMSSASSEPK